MSFELSSTTNKKTTSTWWTRGDVNLTCVSGSRRGRWREAPRQDIGSWDVPKQHLPLCWVPLTPWGRFDWIISRTLTPECTCCEWWQMSPCLSCPFSFPIQLSNPLYHRLGSQNLKKLMSQVLSNDKDTAHISLSQISHILQPFSFHFLGPIVPIETCTKQLLVANLHNGDTAASF